jgi:hypothetical protein
MVLKFQGKLADEIEWRPDVGVFDHPREPVDRAWRDVFSAIERHGHLNVREAKLGSKH